MIVESAALAQDPIATSSDRQHLWLHFTKTGGGAHLEVPMIVRGDGPYVYDASGKRYLDGSSGLYCCNIGHCRPEIGAAMERQARELDFMPIWGFAHPRAVELASRIAAISPGQLNRVFFTSGGSEAIESAIKLTRAYHRRTGNPGKVKFITRETAYHGTTLGALQATGIPALRDEFEPLTPGGVKVPNTNSYRWPQYRDRLWAADAIEQAILDEGPEAVAAVILEPLQNAGGCIPPPEGYFQRVREICDRHAVLLVSDEVICAWGRLGYPFGSQRYRYEPDMITTAKALTSAYAPMGALIASERIAEPFAAGEEMFIHGLTFGGHPVAAAAALANLEIMEEEGIYSRVLAREHELRATLETLRDVPIVGDVRGAGFFFALELVSDQRTKARLSEAQLESLMSGWLVAELLEAGLICRVDSRGDPVIQLAPPLICETPQFEEIGAVLSNVLAAACDRIT